jgi:hypothetical protein
MQMQIVTEYNLPQCKTTSAAHGAQHVVTYAALACCACLQVPGLWQAKAAHEAVHGSIGLQAFIHQHFWHLAAARTTHPQEQGETAAAEAAPGGLAAAAAAGGTNDSISVSGQPVLGAAADSSCPAPLADSSGVPDSAAGAASNSGDSGYNVSFGAASGEAAAAVAGSCAEQGVAATAAAAAASGYQLYYSCCTHRQDSAVVELMWSVLTGQLPEAVLQEQQQQLQALATLVKAVHEQAESAGSVAAAAAAAAAAGSEAAGSAEAASERQQSDSEAGPTTRTDGGLGLAWSAVASALQVGVGRDISVAWHK